ncbi:Nicotinamidase [Thioalkalivibrio nitratireducens DSM 14787]|uniref:Nicotinamidase n=1 Tax=Thioalkalivibrio nitratireducens (strain DSM 14787 / UNIQEM 213 / ALEN2) TaxID=1255043 RepID=L0DTC2_THIND|nr:nicotinamidase [Thioalkalivibrio nitratireducens]AGA32854.1 Nicotinamidase [Thioalkalivibrio nitratireducens DSM 14787]
MAIRELPIPPHFDPESVESVWRVPYRERAEEAEQWAARHGVTSAASDRRRVALLAVDVQNTFCVPGFELFVGGRSGKGAVDDNRRLCQFIYRNLGVITQIVPTLDTHTAFQIFHPLFLIDAFGSHPEPFSQIAIDDIRQGRWRFNEALAATLGISPEDGQRHLAHYVRTLEARGKYALTVWPYHAMLGGISHALVSAVEEAIFFHGVARHSRPDFRVKGRNPLTEHYSVLGPEVTTDPDGEPIAAKEQELIDGLLQFDMVIIAGQAKSHCVAWTIDDLLSEVLQGDARLAHRVYLLEDCCSPVVVPGADYSDQAEAAFQRFAEAGMHVVRATVPMAEWPDIAL